MASLTSNRNLNFTLGALQIAATANVPFNVPDDWADEVKAAAEAAFGVSVTVNSYDRTGSKTGYVVAASDSPAYLIAAADFACDGVADDVEIQAALNALPTRGGKVTILPGTYQISAGVTYTANNRVLIEAYGGVWKLAASVTGLKISQGITNTRGVRVEGLFIDGQSNANTIGIQLQDTNNSELIGVDIENCATGINLDSFAATKFTEGTLIDSVVLRGNTTAGIAMSVESGTGSFMQTIIRGLKCVVGGTGVGLIVPTGCQMLRANIIASFWIDTGQTAVSLDCDCEDLQMIFSAEGAGGATGNIGLNVGTNALNTDQMVASLLLTGTIATQVNNPGTKNFHYRPSGSVLVSSNGNAIFSYRRHGDTTDRLRFEGVTAGGRIQFGSGAALDVNLYRSAANVLNTDDQFVAADGITTKTVAGAVADGSFTATPGSGTIAIDTASSKIWVRVGSTWKSVAVS